MRILKESEVLQNQIVVEPNVVVLGDCLNIMQHIPDKSIDMILTDLPYQRTKNEWDRIIPFDKMWECYERVIKDNGAIVLFADGMFMADLMVSNKKLWKYNLVWDKVLSSGFLNANRQPLRTHEEMVVFYKKQPTYNPQKIKGKPNHSKGNSQKNTNNNYGKFEIVDNRELLGDMKHPTSIWKFQKPHPSKMVHPTEKSLDCIECLIKTYTNEGDVVLDSCMGSGTTILGAENLNRKYIGIEKNEEIFNIALKRLNLSQEGVEFIE